MGLVTCSKCKKSYDYDLYSGICPKCARYNKATTAAEDHQAYHNKYDSGYTHTAQDNHHSFHQKYDEAKYPHVAVTQTTEASQKKKMDKRTKLILGVIIFVFALNLIIPILCGIFSLFFLW